MSKTRRLLAGLFAALVLAAPAAPSFAQPAPVQEGAPPSTVVPLPLSDFRGSWGMRIFSVFINTDGTADVWWRNPNNAADETELRAPKATIVFDRAERGERYGPTIFGTVTSTTDPEIAPLGPVRLTQTEHGLGELVFEARWIESLGQQGKRQLCGPAYVKPPHLPVGWHGC
jgi:hypothetical protein